MNKNFIKIMLSCAKLVKTAIFFCFSQKNGSPWREKRNKKTQHSEHDNTFHSTIDSKEAFVVIELVGNEARAADLESMELMPAIPSTKPAIIKLVTTELKPAELSTEPETNESEKTKPAFTGYAETKLPVTWPSAEPEIAKPVTCPSTPELSTESATSNPLAESDSPEPWTAGIASTLSSTVLETSEPETTEAPNTQPTETRSQAAEFSVEPETTEPITAIPPTTKNSTEPAITRSITTVLPIIQRLVSVEPMPRVMTRVIKIIPTIGPETAESMTSLEDLFGKNELVSPIPDNAKRSSDPVLKKWLQSRIFINTRSPKPDGRPLYSYKTSDKQYAELTDHVATQIKRALGGNRWEKEEFAPLFCMYAAETFCRKHIEGPWKWKTIFDPLCCSEPEQKQILYKWVNNGLSWWKRKIIKCQKNGKSYWLRTLACEGGLPLELLRGDNDRLTRFFSAILERCIRQQMYDADVAEQIAIEEKDNLSVIFHQPEMFRLTGILIAAIIRLQKQIGIIDAETDIITILGQKVPNWKNELPVRVDDDMASRLLAHLVRQSTELTQAISKEAITTLRWRGRLKKNVDSWQLEKWLDIPVAPTAQHIAQWLAQTEDVITPARWVLCLDGREVAWLSRQQGINTGLYHLDFLSRSRAIILTDASLVEPHHLTLYDPVSHQEYSVQTQNSEPWSPDLPWVFVERNQSTEKEWLTEGSARVQNGQAWVVVQPDMLPVESQGCQMIGILVTLGQSIYNITNTTNFSTGADDCYKIECHAALNSQENFAISEVNIVREILCERTQPIYRGIPKIIISRDSWSTLREGLWRPVGVQGSWRGSDHALPRYGQLWIGLVEGDTTRFRRMVHVVPKDFRIERVVSEGNKPGIYRLFGLHGARIEELSDGAKVGEQTEEYAIIACEPQRGMPLPKLAVKLYGLKFSLPWPQRGAAFELAGRLLPNKDLIPASRIGGLKLRLYGVKPGERIWLNARIGRSSMHESLQLHAEENEINLHWLEERIHALLFSSTDLDARVRLTVEPSSSSGQYWATVEISNFDLHAQQEHGYVRVTRESLARLESGWEQRIQMEMIPLWRPNETPRLLPYYPHADSAPTWEIPADMEPGPWWIVGRDGDWARFRPLLWSARGDAPSMGKDRLETAIREPDAERRAAKIHDMLSAMGTDPDHPDWELLMAIIRLTHDFPPSTLDVVKQIVHHPRTLQMAFLRPEDPDNSSFVQLWKLADKLPFTWALLRVQEWLDVAECYFNALHNKLELYAPDETFKAFQRFRKHATDQMKYWNVLCDWLQERLFPGMPISEEGELQRARKNTGWIDYLIKEAQQELNNKHSDDKWPQSSVLDKWHSPYFTSKEEWSDKSAVYNLPLIVANISTRAEAIYIQGKEELIYQMRLIRHFDSDYFDYVHSLELTKQLAQMRLEKLL